MLPAIEELRTRRTSCRSTSSRRAVVHLVGRALAQAATSSRPEDLAHDGRVAEQRLVLCRQRVEPGGDDRLHRAGEQCAASPGSPLPGRSAPCRRIERAPTPRHRRGCPPSAPTMVPSPAPLAAPSSEATSASVSGRERGSRAMWFTRAPARRPGAVSRSSGRAVRDEQERDVGDVAARCSRKASSASSAQCRSSNDEHGRTRRGEVLEEAQPGGEVLVAGGLRRPPGRAARAGAAQPRRGPRPRQDLLELGLDGRAVVGLEDAGVSLHDLAERPEGDALAVRQAAALAPGDQLGARVDVAQELGDQARLADAGLADDEGDLGRRGSTAFSRRARGRTSSISRPTSGVKPRSSASAPVRETAPVASQAATGSACPWRPPAAARS